MSFRKPSPENIQYQCVKLRKEFEQRSTEDKAFMALKRATGLDPIEPDTKFIPGSILSDMAYIEGEPTKVEFLIQVSMYNEGVKNFTDTLGGICDNLETFCSSGVDSSKIACIIIIDGIRPFYSTYAKQQAFFSSFFVEDFIKQRFSVTDVRNCKLPNEQEEDEYAHCFMQRVNFTDNPNCVLNLIFCVKQKNKRKLNTHLWFFGGFCEFLNPKFVMLIDVGTMPLKNSLFLLYEAMATQHDLAGCCGEIRPMDPNIWKLVIPAQVVEYKFSHIFDKALESVLGYITVLPGAFSAYRWEALQGEPLWKDYFKSICHPEVMNAFNSNIYLAEDRVLCLSLISKKNCNYLIRYVKASVAETDVPDTISSLMSQRRRWINGSWFSLVDSIKKCAQIFESSHNGFRKFIFSVQMGYYVVTILFSWVMVGSFYLAIQIVIKETIHYTTKVFDVAETLLLTYLILLIFIFVMSLGVKPSRVESYFKCISIFFGIYMMMVISVTTVYIMTLKYQVWVEVIIILTASTFVIGICLHCAIMTVVQGIFHYVFLTPTYVNIFLIYSICNTHDCTWGNRPDLLTQEERNKVEEFEEFRIRWVIFWVLCNLAYVIILTAAAGSYALYALAFLGTIVVFVRFTGSILYFFQERSLKKNLGIVKASVVVPVDRRSSALIQRLETAPDIVDLDVPKLDSVVPVNKNQVSVLRNNPDTGSTLKLDILVTVNGDQGVVARHNSVETVNKDQTSVRRFNTIETAINDLSPILKNDSLIPVSKEVTSIQKIENKDLASIQKIENKGLASIQKLDSVLSGNRGSSIKIINNKDSLKRASLNTGGSNGLNLTEKASVHILNEINETINNDSEFMKKKSRQTIVDGHRVDEIIVEDFHSESDNTAIMREKRFKKGISLKKLSDLCSITIGRLRMIEDGKLNDTVDMKKIMVAIDEYPEQINK